MSKVDIVSCLLSMDCEEALHAIFLSLDGSSLDACSLVCQSWHKFLQKRVWGCQRVRPVLEAKLRQQWKVSRPTILDKQVQGKSQGLDIVCDDELTLVAMYDGVVKVIRNKRPSKRDRGIREGEESSTVFTLDCSTSHQATFSQHLQFWLGPEVIVTVGSGIVQCWNRLTGAKEYKSAHHEAGNKADIWAVTVLRSGMVATGANKGELVVLNKKEKGWKWLETGEDEGPIWSVKARLVTEDRSQVNHMHTDPGCNHTVVGTQRAITLWDLEEGHVVEGSRLVRANVYTLVYIQPHAFVVLNGQKGVQVWNMMTGDHVKHINIDAWLNRIKTNGSEVILFSCEMRPRGNFGNNFIFVFDASELSDPNVSAENVSWRELLHSGEAGKARNLEAAINNTGIIAVFASLDLERQEYEMTIKTFEFWRAECATEDNERNSLGKMERERSWLDFQPSNYNGLALY